MEKYIIEDHRAHVEAEEKRKAEEEQARAERVDKEGARRAWLADGGDERAFEKAWPSLRDERRRQRVVGADERARQEMRRNVASRI